MRVTLLGPTRDVVAGTLVGGTSMLVSMQYVGTEERIHVAGTSASLRRSNDFEMVSILYTDDGRVLTRSDYEAYISTQLLEDMLNVQFRSGVRVRR
jgi:hypothetical protein